MRCLAALAILLASHAHAQERPSVLNFSMVVAVDFSDSMSDAEAGFVQDALAAALRDQPFVQEVSSGCGAFAIKGFWESRTAVLLPWSVLCSPADALRLAEVVEGQRWPMAMHATNPWLGVRDSLDYFAEAPPARRSMLNVVGDGSQNANVPYATNRAAFLTLKERALTEGVMINALAVEPHKSEFFYENEVVTGFVVPAINYQGVVTAMRVKFQMELALAE